MDRPMIHALLEALRAELRDVHYTIHCEDAYALSAAVTGLDEENQRLRTRVVDLEHCLSGLNNAALLCAGSERELAKMYWAAVGKDPAAFPHGEPPGCEAVFVACDRAAMVLGFKEPPPCCPGCGDGCPGDGNGECEHCASKSGAEGSRPSRAFGGSASGSEAQSGQRLGALVEECGQWRALATETQRERDAIRSLLRALVVEYERYYGHDSPVAAVAAAKLFLATEGK